MNHFGAYDVILAESEATTARIAAKNGLESFAYNLRNTISDEKLKDRFNLADKTSLKARKSCAGPRSRKIQSYVAPLRMDSFCAYDVIQLRYA
jgi:hypothetical protein